MIATALETPLRRSGVAARPQIVTPLNDDEAERRASRARAAILETPTAISDNEALTNCLRVFHENKINKNNVWNMSLIDNFSALVKRHHKSVQNFQVVGSTLEASCKIYGLRVDSVHTDVLHMATGLTALRFEKDNVGEDNNDEADNDENDTEHTGTDAASKAAATKKAPRRRRAIHTVTKNKDSINAKLETVCIIEPTFAKLNTVIGDINSSSRLMNYILPTFASELIHLSKLPFWDSKDHAPVVFTSDNIVEHIVDADHPVMLVPNLRSFELDKELTLRPDQRGYRISDTPAEDDAKDDSMNDRSMDEADIAVAFDVNADIEPNDCGTIMMDTGFDADELNGMSINDMEAIMACRGLQRQPKVIEDLRPVDSSSIHLEYSYRPLDNIDQFWAGPSYWKFRRSQFKRKTLATAGETVKKKPMRKTQEPIDVMKPFDNSLFISLRSDAAKKIRQVDYKKWDSKKLRLPVDCYLNRSMFDFYRFVPDIPVKFSVLAPAPTELEPSSYDYDNPDDREYCSNVQHDDDDTDRDTVTSCENIPRPTDHQADITVLEIPTNFDGAPERIMKIEIPFAKRAKVIDMKQLKHVCLNTIVKQCNTRTVSSMAAGCINGSVDSQPLGRTSFLRVYGHLPMLLSKSMQEALSTAVAFYSILHLANEHQLKLTTCDENDFEIKQKDK